MDELQPIIETVTVSVEPETAFSAFVEEFGNWWPQTYTWSQDVLVEIGIEPTPGGSCYEIGPKGFHCDWGRVVEYRQPQLLSFTWQIGPNREPVPDPDKASAVIVTFESTPDDSTTVNLEHREFQKHGEGAQKYRDAMASDYGWSFILQQYAEYLKA